MRFLLVILAGLILQLDALCAITYRTYATGTGNNSVAISQPTGTTDGDILIAFLVDKATSGNMSAPTGWTWVAGATNGTGYRMSAFSATKGFASCTGTSWTWTTTGRSMGGIFGYYNAHPNNKTTGTATTRFNGVSPNTGTTAVTPTEDGNLVLALFCAWNGGYTVSAEAVATNPGSLTELYDGYYSSYDNMAVAHGLQTGSAGSTGASSCTFSSWVTNGGLLLCLRPTTVKQWAGLHVGGAKTVNGLTTGSGGVKTYNGNK